MSDVRLGNPKIETTQDFKKKEEGFFFYLQLRHPSDLAVCISISQEKRKKNLTDMADATHVVKMI